MFFVAIFFFIADITFFSLIIYEEPLVCGSFIAISGIAILFIARAIYFHFKDAQLEKQASETTPSDSKNSFLFKIATPTLEKEFQPNAYSLEPKSSKNGDTSKGLATLQIPYTFDKQKDLFFAMYTFCRLNC